MIDAINVTNFNQTRSQLQEFILFWIAAAGKNGVVAARSIHNFLKDAKRISGCRSKYPFEIVKALGKDRLSEVLKRNGIGCYSMTHKGGTIWQIANSGIDLKNCTLDELESIKGIGFKTSRCFMIHSRLFPGVAGIDTHALKRLRDEGYQNVPLSTPTSRREYLKWEREFVKLQENSGKSMAEFDLDNWNRYRVGK